MDNDKTRKTIYLILAGMNIVLNKNKDKIN